VSFLFINYYQNRKYTDTYSTKLLQLLLHTQSAIPTKENAMPMPVSDFARSLASRNKPDFFAKSPQAG
jgi:hypothetical protein